MRNIIKIFVFLILFIFSFNFIYAGNNNNIYKNIAVTNNEIITIYGEKRGKTIVKGLNEFFIKIRLNKDKKKLIKLDSKISSVLKVLVSKKNPTYKQKNLELILKNIYYRNKILLETL